MSNIGNSPATGAQRTLLGIQTLTDGWLTIESGTISGCTDLNTDNLTVNNLATITTLSTTTQLAGNISANTYNGAFLSTQSAYHLNLSVNTVAFYQQVGNTISLSTLLFNTIQGNYVHVANASIMNLSSTTASITNLYTASLNVSNVITSTLRCSVASISTLNVSILNANNFNAGQGTVNNLSVTQTITTSNLLVSNIQASTISTNFTYTSFLSCSLAYFDNVFANTTFISTINVSTIVVSDVIANSIYTSYISTNYSYSETGMIRGFQAETTTTNVINTNYANQGYMNVGTLIAAFGNVQTLRTDKALQAAIYTPLSAGDDARDYYSVTFDDDYLYFRTTSGIWKKIALTPF